jgi:hypothetical protein
MATAPQPSRTHPPLAFDIGDDWFIEVECKSADGSPMDIRGAAVEWKLTDATGAAVLTLTAADGGVSIENDTGGAISRDGPSTARADFADQGRALHGPDQGVDESRNRLDAGAR